MTKLASGSASIADLIKRIGWYKGSPTRIVQATFDFFDDVMNQRVDVVDPNSPFVMLVEASAVHTAIAVNDNLINLRRGYIGLAQTDSDIYRHMTDDEYIGRFAYPNSTGFTFMIQMDSLNNAMVYDDEEDCWKAIIPRDTVHTVDNLVFTHEYPIVIRRFPSGAYQISYDMTYESPFGQPANNLIQPSGGRNPQGVSWLYFTVPVKQMKVSSTIFPTDKLSVFRKDIPFDDQFVHARVFNKSGPADSSQWVELRTTHSDQVFDNTVPTAVLTVTTGNLNVTIPYIYNTSNLVTGSLRVDLYTTKGVISVNLSSYAPEAFATQMRSLDEKRDVNAYTNIWGQVSYLAFGRSITTGGKDAIPFSELKQKVTNYATGANQIPITTAQLDATTDLLGFKIIRNTDALTERFFFGLRPLPELAVTDIKTQTQKLISRSNVGIIRYSSDLLNLQSSDNVSNNEPRLTLLSNTLFSLNNGISSMVEASTVNEIKSRPLNELVSTVNAAQYVYTPYYYVFDPKDSILDVRPYDLDNPVTTDLSFVRQNQTLTMAVNTDQYSISKIPTGYRVAISTTSGKVYKDTPDVNVGVQLRFTNADETISGTINGVLLTRDEETGERIYQFDIETNYDIDSEHNLCIINAYNGINKLNNFFVSMETKVDLLFTTNSVTVDFISDQTDNLINKQMLPSNSVGNCHDQITLKFGVFLEHLWARVRTYATGQVYKTSPVDVAAIYETDVYEVNPITGSSIFFDGDGNIEYHKLHEQGDAVLIDGDPVYKYRAGDPILDEDGNPIPISSVGSKNEFEIFVLDGKLLFTTDQIYINYRSQIVQLITGWITTDILEIQKRLIERTKIFFYPQNTLGITKILLDDGQTAQLNSEQSPAVTLFVDDTVINDPTVQENIENAIISVLDARIREQKFTLNTIEEELKAIIGKNVYGVSIRGLGGDLDYQQIRVAEEHNRLALRKKLVVQSDNSITITVDVDISFKSH